MAGYPISRSTYPGLFMAYPPARRNWSGLSPAPLSAMPELGGYAASSNPGAPSDEDPSLAPVDLPDDLDDMLIATGNVGASPALIGNGQGVQGPGSVSDLDGEAEASLQGGDDGAEDAFGGGPVSTAGGDAFIIPTASSAASRGIVPKWEPIDAGEDTDAFGTAIRPDDGSGPAFVVTSPKQEIRPTQAPRYESGPASNVDFNAPYPDAPPGPHVFVANRYVRFLGLPVGRHAFLVSKDPATGDQKIIDYGPDKDWGGSLVQHPAGVLRDDAAALAGGDDASNPYGTEIMSVPASPDLVDRFLSPLNSRLGVQGHPGNTPYSIFPSGLSANSNGPPIFAVDRALSVEHPGLGSIQQPMSLLPSPGWKYMGNMLNYK